MDKEIRAIQRGLNALRGLDKEAGLRVLMHLKDRVSQDPTVLAPPKKLLSRREQTVLGILGLDTTSKPEWLDEYMANLADKFILSLKILRGATGLTLKDAKEMTDKVREQLGLTRSE